MIVKVLYQTRIPSEAVTFLGSTFNGGTKSTLEVEIELDKTGADSHKVTKRTWGETHSYKNDQALSVSGKPDWYRKLAAGAEPLESKRLEVKDSNLKATWMTPGDASHGTRLFVVGANPLASAGPAIDAEFDVGFKVVSGQVLYKIFSNAGLLIKDHDGFPDHTVSVNGSVVYNFDCVAKGQTPGSLLPPSEITIPDTDWAPVS